MLNVLAVAMAVSLGAQQATPTPVDHAKRVLDALVHERFEEVAAEFNAQMAASLTAERLRQVWTTFQQQAGAFQSLIDDRTSTPRPNVTAVVLGCQFEKAPFSVIIAFDADQKIAGLRFMPRSGPSPAPPEKPTSTKFTEEAVTVGTGEWTLPGTLSMPVGKVIAAVVLVHGSGPGDRDETVGANKPFRDLAWGLADRGIAVLRYEKRTRQYPEKLSGMKDFTVKQEVTDDAIAAVALLRGHDRIDPARVFVLGHSLGATLAPRIAAEDAHIAGIIVMAGTTRPLLDVAREQLAYLATIDPEVGDPEKRLAALRSAAPESYWKDLDAYNPVRTAAALTIPILILQGERDYQVSIRDLQGWRDGLGSHQNVTIKTYPTLNHLFEPGEGKSTPAEYGHASHIPDFVFDDIASWLASSGGAR